MTLRFLAALVLLGGCKHAQTIDGQVLDIWGNPIPDATVVVQGEPGRPTTDAYGNFKLPYAAGKMSIKAGREGYIQDSVDLDVVAGQPPPTPILHLYPKPDENGFYVVGSGEYVHLAPEQVYVYGSDLGAVTGIKAVKQRVQSDPFRVVFYSELRLDQIHRLDLKLDQLKYRKTGELTDVLGNQQVKLNLWVSDKEVPTTINPMRSKNAYLITLDANGDKKAGGSLDPGTYAFVTQKLLDTTDPSAVATIPENLRVAFPFEIH